MNMSNNVSLNNQQFLTGQFFRFPANEWTTYYIECKIGYYWSDAIRVKNITCINSLWRAPSACIGFIIIFASSDFERFVCKIFYSKFMNVILNTINLKLFSGWLWRSICKFNCIEHQILVWISTCIINLHFYNKFEMFGGLSMGR